MADENNMQWALVDLMGHVQRVGRISRPGDWGGLLRIDVPYGETYRIEYYGMTAIYSVKLVSEEIARAFAVRQPDVIEYDAPIVTRAQHQAALYQIEQRLQRYADENNELKRRLTAINALLSLKAGGDEDGDPEEEYNPLTGPDYAG
jgi:hypothetical protein